MNPFEMVALIVVVSVFGGVLSTYFKERGKRYHGGEESSREAEQLREQITTLEDRIRVLERIVTDTSGREDLRRQFRDLER